MGLGSDGQRRELTTQEKLEANVKLRQMDLDAANDRVRRLIDDLWRAQDALRLYKSEGESK